MADEANVVVVVVVAVAVAWGRGRGWVICSTHSARAVEAVAVVAIVFPIR